jgi:hypothetical protein
MMMTRLVKWTLMAAGLAGALVVVPSLGLAVAGFAMMSPERRAELEALGAAAAERDRAAAAAKAKTAMAATIEAHVAAALRDTDGRLVEWEITSGDWLAIIVELPEHEGWKARRVGEKTLLAVRNALHGHSPVDSYLVSVNGPSRGPGLTARHGSARFIEGGSVDWKYGTR